MIHHVDQKNSSNGYASREVNCFRIYKLFDQKDKRPSFCEAAKYAATKFLVQISSITGSWTVKSDFC